MRRLEQEDVRLLTVKRGEVDLRDQAAVAGEQPLALGGTGLVDGPCRAGALIGEHDQGGPPVGVAARPSHT